MRLSTCLQTNLCQNPHSLKDSVFNKRFQETWESACGRMEVDPYLLPYIQINSKWIKDLNARPETTKILKEKIGGTLQYIGTGKSLPNKSLGAQEIWSTTDKWVIIK